MKKLLFLTLLCAAFGGSLFAQTLTPAGSSTGSITTNAANCNTTNACITLHMASSNVGYSVTASGTWTGTLTVEQSGDNQGSWSSVTTTTSNTLFTSALTPGITDVRVRGSAAMTGAAVITITASGPATLVNSSGGGSGSSSASLGMGTIIASNPAYGVKANWQVESAGANFTVTSGSNIVTCSTCKFLTSTFHPAVVGDQMFATTWDGFDNHYSSAIAVTANGTTPIAITSVDSDTQVHISVNASGNAGTTNTNNGMLAWGTDDTAAHHLAKVAAFDGLVCLPDILPGGITNINNAEWDAALCRGLSIGSTASKYPAVIGWGSVSTTILLPPWFNNAQCAFGVSGTACFGGVGTYFRLQFTGLGQSTFSLGAHNWFETVNDASYEDLIFSGMGGPTGVQFNTGQHTFQNISIDGFGTVCAATSGQHLVFQTMFIGNCTGNLFNVGGAGGWVICYGCAYQYTPTTTGIAVQVTAGARYHGYEDSHFLFPSISSAGYFANGGTIFLDGVQVLNTGNTASTALQANGTGSIYARNSNLQGGATRSAWACQSTAFCKDDGGNAYPGGVVGLAPTVTGTIWGTTPTITLGAGSNTPERGSVTVTEGTGTPTSGTLILTFNQTFSLTPAAANPPSCFLTFTNGTGSWNARVSGVVTTAAATAMTWQIDNNAATLTAGSTYGLTWECNPR